MRDPEQEIETALDAICLLGCEVVNAYIGALRSGQSRPEYRALDAGQRALLLEHLQSIMAVYAGR